MPVTKTRKVHDGSTMSRSFACDRNHALRNAKIVNMWEAVDKDGYRKHSQAEIADKFGLTQGTVSQIVNNPNSCFYR